MKGISHNILRILRNPVFIVLMVIFIIIPVFASLSGLAFTSTVKNDVLVYGVVNYEGNAYFDSYATDYLGHALAGINITIDIYGPLSISAGSPINITSNSRGYGNVSLGPDGNLTNDFLSASIPGGSVGNLLLNIGGPQISLYPLFNSSYAIGSIRTSPSSFYSEPLIAYFNQSGNLSSPVNVYIQNGFYGIIAGPSNNRVVMGPYSGFTTQIVPLQYGNYSDQFADVNVNTVSNNTTVANLEIPVYSMPPGYSIFISAIGTVPAILGFFMVMLGLYAVSIVYGKDESTGAFEVVLSKSVTRRQLLVQRYISAAAVMTGLVLGTIGLIYLILLVVARSAPPIGFVASLIFGLAIPTLSLMAIAFLFAKYRRAGEVIGVVVLFALIIGAFIINVVISTYFNSANIPTTVGLLTLATPINYYDLFLNAFYPGLASFSGIDLVPANVYPNPLAIIIGGAAWVAFPILLFWYRANKSY